MLAFIDFRMDKNFIILVASVIMSCGTHKSTEEQPKESTNIRIEEKAIESDSVVITQTVNGIKYFNYKLRRWNGITWNDYTYTGHPDTAVTLMTYKILTSEEEPDFGNYAIYINLYENTNMVKSIIQAKFSEENQTELIFNGIDKINEDFVKYAKKQVQNDMKEFGQSDGPYYSFVQRHVK